MWSVTLETAVLLVNGWIAALFFWRPALWRLVIPKSINILRVASLAGVMASALDVLDNFGPLDAWLFAGADAARLVLEEGVGNALGGLLFGVGILSSLWEAPYADPRFFRLEERIRDREKRLREAQRVAKLGFYDNDLTRGELIWSGHLFTSLGYRTDEFNPTIELFSELTHPDDLRRYFEVAQGSTPEEPDYDVTIRMRARSGEWRHIRARGSAEFDTDGRMTRRSGTAQDITDLVEAKELAENRLRALNEAQAVGRVGTFDYDCLADRITDTAVNFRFLGYDPRELERGMGTVYGRIHPDDLQRTIHIIESATPESPRYECEFRIRNAAGQWRVYAVQAKCEYDSKGTCTRRFGAYQDITQIAEARALEAQLRQTQKLETLGTLAGGIAHDFNNILTPILGFAELALMRQGADVAEDLAEIKRGAERGAHLVSQILSFSRKSETKKSALDLHAIVSEVLRLARASLPASLEIVRSFRAVHVMVVADATQLHQVVMNLVTNAHHAMKGRDGGELRVEIDNVVPKERERLGGSPAGRAWVRLTVADNGCGMPPEVRDRIFEPFFTTKAPGSGTGLGLSVVHGIVTDHGGSIHVNTEPGVGTRFEVWLPCADRPGAAASESESESASELGLGGNERVLVLDDEAPVTALARAYLSRLGYQVAIANDPAEVLDMLRAGPSAFDLLVADQTMPGMSGMTLIRELRNARCQIPAILMTGYSERGMAESLSALGISQVLTKPFGVAKLAKAIRDALNGPELKGLGTDRGTQEGSRAESGGASWQGRRSPLP